MKKKRERPACLIGQAYVTDQPSKSPGHYGFYFYFFYSTLKKIITSDKLFIAADDLLLDLLVFNHMLKIF